MKKFLILICCVLAFSFVLPLTGCAEDGQVKTYTINFVVDGTIYDTVTNFADINTVSAPTKQYCDFIGWVADIENVENNTLTLNAKFKLNSRYKCLEVLSNSMFPAFKIGEYIIIDTQATEFKVNDVIAFKIGSPELIVTHRIIAVDGDNFTTKGDNTEGNQTVTIDQIIGLVCENIGATLPEDVIG